jgi:hypothetical protein
VPKTSLMNMNSKSNETRNNGQPVIGIIIDDMTAVRLCLQDVIGLERANICQPPSLHPG